MFIDQAWCSAEAAWLVLGCGLPLWIRVLFRAGIRARFKANILVLGWGQGVRAINRVKTWMRVYVFGLWFRSKF